jgi:hypothetical protein
MKYAGYCVTNKEIKSSRNMWGPIEEITKVFLPVLERNEYGDCLCYLKGKGLVDIDSCDVKSYVPNSDAIDPLEQLLNMLKSYVKE